MPLKLEVLVRRPGYLIYVAGNLALPHPLDITITSGLDQERANCVISYPWPLAASIDYWKRIVVLIGYGAAVNPDYPANGMTQRFVAYITGFSQSLWPGAIAITCEDVM